MASCLLFAVIMELHIYICVSDNVLFCGDSDCHRKFTDTWRSCQAWKGSTVWEIHFWKLKSLIPSVQHFYVVCNFSLNFVGFTSLLCIHWNRNYLLQALKLGQLPSDIVLPGNDTSGKPVTDTNSDGPPNTQETEETTEMEEVLFSPSWSVPGLLISWSLLFRF